MKKVILKIDGMTCSACSSGLEKYINKQNGIYNSSVNLVMANMTVEYDENILQISKIEEYVKKAGFKSLGEFKSIDFEKKNKKDKIVFIIYTILAILLMYISMGHMINLPSIPYLDVNDNHLNYILSLFIISVIFLIYGRDILKNGYKNLVHMTPNMDTLVSLGILTSFIYSMYNSYLVLSGKSNQVMNLYFESSSIVIYFVKLGRYIDRISKYKTKEAIKGLVTITPQKAIRKVKHEEIEVTLDEIKKGDILIAKSGDKIAVDGTIISGNAHFDDSFITGESKKIRKKEGEFVYAGSLNYDGYIEYKAEKIGKDSTVSEIVRLVIEASNTKTKMSKLADKVSGIFVPVVFLISFITFLFYFIITKDLNVSIETFVTILVVACPCSLGIATPLATIVSEGVCATSGILVKKSEILENVSKVQKIVFDKTGTLTYGNLKISKVFNYSNIGEEEMLKIVSSIESKVSHPIANAFDSYVLENKIQKLEVESVNNIAGFGVVGSINNDNYILGNAKILDKYSIKNEHLEDEKILLENENSIIYVVKNNEIISLIGVNDFLRTEAKEVINNLEKHGIETVMLTGDNSKIAKKIADEVRIKNVFCDITPKEKLEKIKSLKEENKLVMMCGDGINDSPALSYSDIGVSIKSATSVAQDSSDVILINNDLNSLIKLIKIGKKTVKIIKQNLFWAFFYNLIMIVIAIGVLRPFGIYITPMIASLAMVFSSISVVLNTLRIKKIK